MKVLQLYYKMPIPAHDGGACSIYSASLSILSQGIDLRILAMNPVKAPGDINLIPVGFVKETRFESVSVDNRINALRAFMNLFGQESYFAQRFYSAPFANRLTEILHQEDFDIIQLEHLYLCHYLNDIRKASSAKVVLRAQNVENRVWHDYSRKLKNPFLRRYLGVEAQRLERFEKQMVSKPDGIIALTVTDAEYFRKIAGRTEIAVIPFGIDFSTLADTNPSAQFSDFPIVYHLGSMDWRPNIQGLEWFVDKVLPLVVRSMPGIRICIGGRNMPRRFFRKSSRNLIVESEVDDAGKYQAGKAIMIVPLLSGSGIRVKILNGMAMGKTIISTSIGATDICAVNNESIIIADNPDEFARQICRCAGSELLCREIGRKAQAVAIDNYELKNIGIQMKQFYQLLMSGD